MTFPVTFALTFHNIKHSTTSMLPRVALPFQCVWYTLMHYIAQLACSTPRDAAQALVTHPNPSHTRQLLLPHLGQWPRLPHKLSGDRGTDVRPQQALGIHLVVKVDSN